MAVKIKLMRMGKIRHPQYRIVVADARTKRDGRAIEEIGKYHPKENPSFIEVNSERAQYWLGVGAQPTEPVLNLLKITGDWQKFKGLPGAEGRLKVAQPKPDKKAVFMAAAKEAMKEDEAAATTTRSKKRAEPKKKAEPKKGKAEAAKVEGVQDDAKDNQDAKPKDNQDAKPKAKKGAEPKAETPSADAQTADTGAESTAEETAEAKSEA